ncbi:hypothetical protein GCM10022255_115120 [Dactylosporangium darangshiense]|uniref:Uncharacterized protein n=1 Tax=Dactylosporangium darangshiense TaxID=579108 RepID=A0ABP8DW65_9ACTN
MTRRLEQDLLAAGEHIVRVPPKLMAHVRDAARAYGKSDPIDVLTVARAAPRETGMPIAFLDGPTVNCGCSSITAKIWWLNATARSTAALAPARPRPAIGPDGQIHRPAERVAGRRAATGQAAWHRRPDLPRHRRTLPAPHRGDPGVRGRAH